jgi:hypothetical protein
VVKSAEDRCSTCDRPKCDYDERRRVQEGGDRSDAWCYDYWFDDERCHHLRKDWRSEALASRALLREMLHFNHGAMHDTSPTMAERIRDHLAGKP